MSGTGPVSPRVPTAKVLPFLFGEGHVRAKNRLNVRRTPDPRLVCSQRITCTMCVQGKVRIRTPRNEAMSWGSPGMRNSHAGTYGELTPMAPTGRGWLRPAPYPLRESKDFHTKSQTVRFFGTTSSLCGFVPVQKSRLELSSEGYAARVVPSGAASKWPGRDTPGGTTIRPCMCARVLTRLKRWGWVAVDQPFSVGRTTIHGGHAGCLVGSPGENEVKI